MKLSQTGMGTVKLNNIDEMYPGQSILLQTGQLVQYGAGIFGYNTIPLLVKKKIESIIEETLNKYGCIEVLLPTLQAYSVISFQLASSSTTRFYMEELRKI